GSVLALVTASGRATQKCVSFHHPHRPPETNSFSSDLPAMANVILPQEIWDHEVATIQYPQTQWLWDGFVSPRNIMLLTSPFPSSTFRHDPSQPDSAARHAGRVRPHAIASNALTQCQ